MTHPHLLTVAGAAQVAGQTAGSCFPFHPFADGARAPKIGEEYSMAASSANAARARSHSAPHVTVAFALYGQCLYPFPLAVAASVFVDEMHLFDRADVQRTHGRLPR